jgi:hypothetical protein
MLLSKAGSALSVFLSDILQQQLSSLMNNLITVALCRLKG